MFSALAALFFDEFLSIISELGKRGKIPRRASIDYVVSAIQHRKISDRINWKSIITYLAIRYLLEVSLTVFDVLHSSLPPSMFLLRIPEVSLVLLILLLHQLSNKGLKTLDALETVFYYYDLALKRARHTLKFALSSNLRFLIPGFVLLSILGVISVELWQFFNTLSWWQIALIAVVFLVPISISAQKKITRRIERTVYEKTDKPDVVTVGEIRKSLKHLSGKFFYSVDDNEFEHYQRMEKWKWKENILYRVQIRLIDDLRRQLTGVYWITVFSVSVIFFVFIFLSSILFFPPKLLQQIVPQEQETYFLYTFDQDFDEWFSQLTEHSAELKNDILLKYAAILTIFLLGQFIISYPNNEEIFDELGLDDQTIADLSSLLYALLAMRENGFQEVMIPREVSPQQDLYFWLTIIMIPDEIEENQVDRYAEKIVKVYQHVSLISPSHLRFILIKASAFKCTAIYKEINGLLGFRNILTENPKRVETNAWVYLGKDVGGEAVRVFDTLEDAKNWLGPQVVPKYQ